MLLKERLRKEVNVTRGRRRRQLLDDLKEKREYWKLKEEELDLTLQEPVLEEATDLSRDRLRNE
jgi:hypothetical protein